MYFPKSLTIPLIVCSHIGVPSSLLPSKLDNCGSFSALNIPTESLSTEHLPPECHHFKYLHVKLSHRDMLLHDTGTSNLRLSIKFAFFSTGVWCGRSLCKTYCATSGQDFVCVFL